LINYNIDRFKEGLKKIFAYSKEMKQDFQTGSAGASGGAARQ